MPFKRHNVQQMRFTFKFQYIIDLILILLLNKMKKLQLISCIYFFRRKTKVSPEIVQKSIQNKKRKE